MKGKFSRVIFKFLDKGTWGTTVPFNEIWKQFWKRSFFN